MKNLKSLCGQGDFMRRVIRVAKKATAVIVATVTNASIITKALLVLSFAVPFSILYVIDPPLFEATWIGRTFYLFFLWLVILEIIMSSESLQNSRLKRVISWRAVLFIVVLVVPTLYVVWANYFGLNDLIRAVAQQNKMEYGNALLLRIPVEYLVFTLAFALMVMLAYGIKGLKGFSTSILFLGIIGMLYMIDTVYPGNTFAPFQILVPATTQLSANVLNLMGYYTRVSAPMQFENYGMVPLLEASKYANMQDSVGFFIAWACSGIESLLIYTAVMMLFLKGSAIRTIYKVACFVVGAVITYFINILRVVSFFVITFNGGSQQAVDDFHNYYGPLYSVLWITSYPLIIIGIHALSVKYVSMRSGAKRLDQIAPQN